MIKQIITAIILIPMLFSAKAYALEKNDLSADCAVLMNAQSGEVVFAKNPYKRCSMASTTKIMTSLLAIESGKLQNEIVVTDEMVRVEGTSMGLMVGDSVSLDELLHGMLLQSGNDAANAAALYLTGNLGNFSALMNSRAGEIGMNDTNFVTPSGLDSENHYSTAYDMALLGIEAVRNPKFLSVCSKQKETLEYGNPPYSRTLYNHNKLLDRFDCVYGIKTGFTKKSGRCLVSYAVKNGVGLVAVTLNAPDDWNDHEKLFDFGFDQVKSEELYPELPDSVSAVGGEASTVSLKTQSYTYSHAEGEHAISYKVFLPEFVYAPVKKGDVLGKWEVYIDGKKTDTISIIADDNVN